MSRYHGAQPKGAARLTRDRKRAEAEARNAATPRERTAQWRRDKAAVRAAVDAARSAA